MAGAVVPPKPSYSSPAECLRCWAWHVLRNSVLTALFLVAVRPLYARLMKRWRGSERGFFIAGTTAVHVSAYLAMNVPFLLCDHFGLLQRYKLDRKPAQQPTAKLMLRTLLDAVVGQAVIGPLGLRAFGFALFKALGMPTPDAALPSFPELVRQFAICNLFNHLGFYAAHRTLHEVPWLYKNVHKQHHEYKGTIGIAAEHAHPIEQMTANLIPTMGGSLFFGRHPLVFWVFLAARLQQTYEGHSGYCFAGTWAHRIGLTNADGAAFHDHHHTTNVGNYAGDTTDYMFGTDAAWVKEGGMAGYLARKRGSGGDAHPGECM